MFMPKAHGFRWSSPETLDDLFLTHYAALIARAQQLVGDRHAAEDLVHDVYVRLALRHLDLGTVQNIDGYLFTTLRNVHLSQVRRRMVTVSATVSIVDHESAVSSLRSISDDEQRQAAHEALSHVVRYACLRKATSRAASILILRFFHGYYPGEIARVVRATDAAVSERLRVARAEARAYLADPGRVRSFDACRATRHVGTHVQDDTASVRALRHAIFDARTGWCLTERLLDRLYGEKASDPPDVATLAHLVSCAACLDTVNRWLGLPLLAERDVADNLGRGGPSTGSGGGSADLTDILRTRLDAAREDHPQELQIAVNGLFVGAQAVHGPMTEQRLKILITEQVGFIEIFDEHNLCLLYLDIQPPPHGAVEQTTRVALSGGRQLTANLAFSDASPTLHVVYDNPLPSEHGQSVLERARDVTDEARTSNKWGFWPVGLRFVIAGIIVGVLLANPSQTVAAMDHLRRAIAGSLAQLIEAIRPHGLLPSRSIQPAGLTPLASPALRVSPIASTNVTAPGVTISDIALSSTMLEALRLLDETGALTIEQISVAAGADRRVHVEGVVGTDTRRQELTRALHALPIGRVRVDLVTLDAAIPRLGPDAVSAPAALRSAELTNGRVPAAYEHVRRYVAAGTPRDAGTETGAAPHAAGASTPAADAAVSNTVRRTSARLLSRALDARVQARTVRELMTAVSSADAPRLPPAALATWCELVRRHAESFRHETTSLRDELERIFPSPAQDEELAGGEPGDDVWRMAARMFELASVHDVTVRRAFAVAADGHESLDVGTPAFRRSLSEADRLATALIEAMNKASR